MSGSQPRAVPTFVRRRLDIAFSLGEGQFGDTGSQNTVTLTGLRASINVVKVGISLASAEIRIYGMTLSDMNRFTTLGKPVSRAYQNSIAVSAGVAGEATAIVFQGIISAAWADLNSAPEVPFIVLARDGGMLATKPIPATSYKGAVDVATIMAGLADQLALTLENNGVSVMLTNPYLAGDAYAQIRWVAEHAGINFTIENEAQGKGTLAIWPKGGSRGKAAVVVSPETGMVGWPAFTMDAIFVKVLFNPTILFGSQVEVRSELTPACGFWTPVQINHDLESETPNGQWFTTMMLNIYGHVTAVAHG